MIERTSVANSGPVAPAGRFASDAASNLLPRTPSRLACGSISTVCTLLMYASCLLSTLYRSVVRPLSRGVFNSTTPLPSSTIFFSSSSCVGSIPRSSAFLMTAVSGSSSSDTRKPPCPPTLVTRTVCLLSASSNWQSPWSLRRRSATSSTAHALKKSITRAALAAGMVSPGWNTPSTSNFTPYPPSGFPVGPMSICEARAFSALP